MSVVTVKSKYEVVIPQRVRTLIGIAVGDRLEARAEKGRIVLEPRSAVNRGITESLADFKAGRTLGPFKSAAAAIASMKRDLAKPTAKTRRRVSRSR